MNTICAVARTATSTPIAVARLAGYLSVSSALLAGAALSEALIDDALILSAVALFAFVFYLQPCWAMGAVEKLCPPEVVWRLPTKQARAALTIDDIPLLNSPTSFEEILNVLRENRVTATFFVMSGFDLDPADGGMENEARLRCRELLKRAVAEGHELGNHMQFETPAIAMTTEAFDKSFHHCDALLAEICGEKAWRARARRWFRPASALWSQHILARARENGYTTVISNCYPHDVASVTRHINAAYLARRARPGAVIVVHDRWHTAETLRKALPLIANKGLQLCTLSELQAVVDAEASKHVKKLD